MIVRVSDTLSRWMQALILAAAISSNALSHTLDDADFTEADLYSVVAHIGMQARVSILLSHIPQHTTYTGDLSGLEFQEALQRLASDLGLVVKTLNDSVVSLEPWNRSWVADRCMSHTDQDITRTYTPAEWKQLELETRLLSRWAPVLFCLSRSEDGSQVYLTTTISAFNLVDRIKKKVPSLFEFDLEGYTPPPKTIYPFENPSLMERPINFDTSPHDLLAFAHYQLRLHTVPMRFTQSLEDLLSYPATRDFYETLAISLGSASRGKRPPMGSSTLGARDPSWLFQGERERAKDLGN